MLKVKFCVYVFLLSFQELDKIDASSEATPSS